MVDYVQRAREAYRAKVRQEQQEAARHRQWEDETIRRDEVEQSGELSRLLAEVLGAEPDAVEFTGLRWRYLSRPMVSDERGEVAFMRRPGVEALELGTEFQGIAIHGRPQRPGMYTGVGIFSIHRDGSSGRFNGPATFGEQLDLLYPEGNDLLDSDDDPAAAQSSSPPDQSSEMIMNDGQDDNEVERNG